MAAPPGQSAQQRHVITKQASGSAKIDPLMAAFKRHPVDVREPLIFATEQLRNLIRYP